MFPVDSGASLPLHVFLRPLRCPPCLGSGDEQGRRFFSWWCRGVYVLPGLASIQGGAGMWVCPPQEVTQGGMCLFEWMFPAPTPHQTENLFLTRRVPEGQSSGRSSSLWGPETKVLQGGPGPHGFPLHSPSLGLPVLGVSSPFLCHWRSLRGHESNPRTEIWVQRWSDQRRS